MLYVGIKLGFVLFLYCFMAEAATISPALAELEASLANFEVKNEKKR